MTRSEALELCESNGEWISEEIINQIYDDFEKRTCITCANCRSYHHTIKDVENSPYLECSLLTYPSADFTTDYIDVDKDFYCNRYKPKGE